jgi:TIR domain-containing protein/uncharacterized protein DUF4062
MSKKRVFISSRIQEMREFREAAVKAIVEAGMEPLYFDSTDPEKRWPLKPGVSIIRQLLDGVKTSDVFLGLYGQTLNDSWTPDGYKKHSMELEYETAQAARLPCFCYVAPAGAPLDADMAKLRKKLMKNAVEFTSSPDALYEDLLHKLQRLTPRVFISYSSKDQKLVDQLYSQLKQSGHSVWFNTESIPKGEHWYDEMVKGLHDTDLLILVVSKDAMASEWVAEEWKTFLKMKKKIIPILHKPCKVPKEINKLEMIKTSDKNWYYKVLKAVEQNL